jgi:outer membrane protein TolC
MNPSFIETKLDAQLRLSTAQQQEITALTNYNLALAKLERAKGTLLRYDNVTLEEEPRPTVPLTWK